MTEEAAGSKLLLEDREKLQIISQNTIIQRCTTSWFILLLLHSLLCKVSSQEKARVVGWYDHYGVNSLKISINLGKRIYMFYERPISIFQSDYK